MPDSLRGDATIRYQGSFGSAGLIQNDEKVGMRRISSHEITVDIEFAPVTGVSVYAKIPHTVAYTVTFPESYPMNVDPATGFGRYMINEAANGDITRKGSGSPGVWMGVGLAPYAERFKKKHQITWRLDLAFRTQAKRTFWETDEAGDRGVSQGGTGWHIGGAFSADNGRSRPFMSADWIMETRRPVQGTVDETPVEIQTRPGSSLKLRTGVELVIVPQRTETSPEPYLEASAGFGYRSWSDIPSGVLLPTVLESSRDNPVTRADYLTAQVQMAFGVRFLPWAQWRVDGLAVYRTPHIIEDVYAVRTSADAIEFGISSSLSIGYR